MDRQLFKRLDSAASRLRKRRMIRGAAIVVWIGFLIALLIRSNGPDVTIPVVVGFVGVGWLLTALIAWRSFRDRRWLAVEIEKSHPDLQQRLLTAVERADRPDDYFHRRLVREAVMHARHHPWESIVSSASLWFSRAVSLAGTLALAVVLLFFVVPPPRTPRAASRLGQMSLGGVQIQPGETEVQKRDQSIGNR